MKRYSLFSGYCVNPQFADLVWLYRKFKERIVKTVNVAETESVTSCENHLCDASFHIAESH